ncbi:hypothetical protein [Oceanobacillus kimchii]|uniref:Uncharacterized protein n=1 Tax=Oceanobacillus kimchii TaxID=746691 RepID=A0ABQ5TF65_9BACI|nr:hypothetical protein [Oceanobacillus kimchii]GLO64757.1 hypothetical protein MACH08_05410 [Oceanobacillus kimchii]
MPKFFFIITFAVLVTFLFTKNVHAQEVTTIEVYEALLDTKETLIQYQSEKINLLNNTITWIIAISALFSTVAIAVITYIYRTFLNDIKKRNEQLKQQEKVISKIIEAEEFQEKLESLQNELTGLQQKQKNFQKRIGNPNDMRW